ncbi:MAG: MarR family transcriptional regulator [Proteobacteria bacterium]|nr:MarR family transcriptional regulator [Pseudomonadota bacterium]
MDPNEKAANLKQSFTRFSRYYNLFMRQRHASSITVQQCYILEALLEKPLTMNRLAVEIGVHQSTLTRIVAKLEKLDLILRTRKQSNQRIVEVSLTASGEILYRKLNQQSLEMIIQLLGQIPEERQPVILETMEYLSKIFDPSNPLLTDFLTGCCSLVDVENS